MLIGAIGLWLYSTDRGRSTVYQTGQQIDTTTKAAREQIQEKLADWKLSPEDIKEDLSHGSQIVRRKAEEAGEAIADATADARVTAAIKAKLFAHKELSGMNISVNTTAGVVTLSGAVPSRDHVSKAMLLAMDTDGVREVISTLQVIPPPSR